MAERAWVEQIMGLPVSVHVRLRAREPGTERAVAAAFALLRAADRRFSPYRADSELSAIHRGQLRVDDADPEVREVLALCEEARQGTGGYFDALLPGPDGRPRLDPCGLVKGWAAQRAADLLAAAGLTDYCLNAGGDIALHADPWLPAWRVGVEDPTAPERMATVLDATAGAVATSGTGRRGAHIIDPYTGLPATAVASATVVGPSLLWADVYATAIVAHGALLPLPPGYSCPLLVLADSATTSSVS